MKKQLPGLWRTLAPLIVFGTILCGIVFASSNELQKSNPAQWTDDDVYKILNNSPWSKSVKVKYSAGNMGSLSGSSPSGGANNGNWGSSGQMPGSMGRRGGYGGGGGSYGGSRSSGSSSGQKSGGSNEPKETEAVVQWQSALPVRLAQQRKDGQTAADAAQLKPQDEYLIGVIGLPLSDFGHGAGADDSDREQDRIAEIQEHLKGAASLIRSGHEAIHPTKVDVDQGHDGRMVFHFAKSDPITAGEKEVEFRVASPRMELKRKFVLKEMQFDGRLDL